jgi:hypothetical protein
MYYVISPELFALQGDALASEATIRFESYATMSIDYWIDRLEDPFEMFALVHVLRSLGALADESESSRSERAGWWGVSPKYYSVEDEHDIEVVEHLIGSAFVLAQTSITQAVSILRRMREDAGCPVWIPKDKATVLSTAAPIHAELGISHITIINTAADYYKHRVEWREEDWAGPTHKNKTIANVIAIGLGPKGYHNMSHALRELQIYPDNMAPLGSIVGSWRESLADYLRSEGAKHGVSIHPRFPEDLDTDQPSPTPPTILKDDPPF